MKHLFVRGVVFPICRRFIIGTLLLTALCGGRAWGQTSAWSPHVFAPYVDVTGWPPFDFVGVGSSNGAFHCTLAFIVADETQDANTAPPENIPAWGAYTALSTHSQFGLTNITALRALGGDVIISFGGEANTELANYITNSARLKAAYASVISNYSATRIDFDIEGAAIAYHADTDRRSAVLASLQADATNAGRTLQIWLTLPVEPVGLLDDGLYTVNSAISNHVDLAGVNIMAMDFAGFAPNPAGNMGYYAIAAATNTFAQLKAAYQAAGISKTDGQLWSMIGITPMLGNNDTGGETFDLTNAGQVVQFAESVNVGLLSFWSWQRDQSSVSGITQQPYDFTKTFVSFETGGAVNPSLSVSDASVVTSTNGLTNLVFNVQLSPPSTGAVSVAYATLDGTAVAPGNYLATNGTLNFAAGQMSGSVTVAAVGSTNAATNTFFFVLTNSVGAGIIRTQAVGTIINPGIVTNPPVIIGSGGECAITAQWAVTYDNGAAFQANLTLANPNATNITINALGFDAPYSLSYIYQGNYGNAIPSAPVGGHYLLNNGWPQNQPVLPANGSLLFQLQGAPGNGPPAPANLKINGILLGSCGGAPDYSSWALGIFGCTNCPQAATNADPDGDSMNNLQEFLAGTNPTNAASVLRIASANRQGADVVLTWTTAGGKTNHVMAGGSLTNWTDLSGPLLIPGTGDATSSWTNSGGATNSLPKFYRILCAP